MSEYICKEIDLEKVFSAVTAGKKVIVYKDTTKTVVEVNQATVYDLVELLNDRENCFYYAFVIEEAMKNVLAAESV